MGVIRKFAQQALAGIGWSEPKADGEMTSPFDVIRHEDMHGEYWLARELAPRLGYGANHAQWQNFVSVIGKARAALKNLGHAPDDHCTDVNTMIEIGKGGHRAAEDFRLSRRACYMVALCGDARKPEVAAAKNYFIETTRAAELGIAIGNPKLSAKIDRWAAAGKDWAFIENKLKAEIVRGVWTDTHQDAGIKGWGYSHLTRAITKKLMGKYPAEIREERGVKKTRDGFTVPELVNMAFAESLSAQMVAQNARKGYQECKADCEIAAENTMRAINDSLRGKAITE